MKGKLFKRLTRCKPRQLLLGCLATTLASPGAYAGFHVHEGQLLDGFNKPFVMRGINHPHVWYAYRTEQALKDIAATGANAVRIVLGSGHQWPSTSAEEVARIIAKCKARKMIAVLEVHDVTGYGEKPEAAPLSAAVDYWLSIQDTLMGQEDYVIINIGNEPLGNNVPTTAWAQIHQEAIQRLRDAGFTHTLMVDAPTWGQDWRETMLQQAPEVFATDPLQNLVFSVHMYQVYAERSKIDNYLSTFVNVHKLPLVVGEFGADHQGEEVDEAAILELADFYRIGYLGWSWSGNSGGTESLDITHDFDANRLTPWGDFLINSAYGIRATAKPASVFTGGETGPQPPKTLPQSLQVTQGRSLDITLFGSDADGAVVAFQVDAQPRHGVLVGADRFWTYTPAPGFVGEDSFTYVALDNDGLSSTPARVDISVEASTDAKVSCDYRLVNEWGAEWDAGFIASMRITNTSTTPLHGWEADWAYEDATRIVNVWNGELSGENPYHVSSMSWNAEIPPGASVEFGMQGVKGDAASTPRVIQCGAN
ncbi:cellulase family glycosylhydrolase [Hahella sp. NBU794]|uniref:cellulase family glycosylhydrolase n=1 Tax=Hahella sp. NBU794 TaxID=3422590 RepID=UPI003D6DCB5B